MPIFDPPGDVDFVPVGAIKARERADLLTQLMRGGAYGVTSGLFKPFADAGEGGIPEELAKIAGLGAGVFPWVRGAGLGVGLASRVLPKLAPKLLKPGVSAADAMANMFRGGRQLGPSLSLPGAALAYGTALPAQAEFEEAQDVARGDKPKTMGSRLFSGALGAAFGAWGGRSLSKVAGLGGKTVADVAAPVAEQASQQVARVGLTFDQSLERIAERRLALEQKLADGKLSKDLFDKQVKELDAAELHFKAKAGLVPPPLTKAERAEQKLVDKEVKKQIDKEMAESRAARTEGTAQWEHFLGPEATPQVTPSMRRTGAPDTGILQNLPGGTFGIGPPTIDLMERQLPEGLFGMTKPVGRSPQSVSGIFGMSPGTGAPTESEAFQALWPKQMLPGKGNVPPAGSSPSLQQIKDSLYPPHLDPGDPRGLGAHPFGEAAGWGDVRQHPKVQEILRLMEDPDYYRSQQQMYMGRLPFLEGSVSRPSMSTARRTREEALYRTQAIGGGSADPIQLRMAELAMQDNAAHVIPGRTAMLAGLASNIPMASPGKQVIERALEPLPATGFAPMLQFLEKKLRAGGGAMPSFLYAGVRGLQDLPRVMDQTLARVTQIQMLARQDVADVFALPTATKDVIRQIFHVHGKSDPEVFFAEIADKAPEARGVVDQLRSMMDLIHNEYVADGVLRPKQRITNYFPDVREVLGLATTGELHIERGLKDFFPIEIENLLRNRVPQFAKSRTMPIEEAFARLKTFDDVLDMYIAQYARFKAVREFEPRINGLLSEFSQFNQGARNAYDYLVPRVKDYMDAFMGQADPAGRLSQFWKPFLQGVREYQFIRTIGYNALSPIMNYFQKLNTFAVVGSDAFFQAFNDMKDPARLLIARQTGLLDRLKERPLLEKMGIEGTSSVLNPGFSESTWAKVRGGQWFSKAEESNQLHAFMAGLRHAEARGITGTAKQADYAWNVMNDTQFIQNQADRIPWFQGEFGRTVGQFQGFRFNQTRFMVRLVEEALRGAKTGDAEKLLQGLLPLVRYTTPLLALQPISLLPGDWSDEHVTKEIFGKASKIPGFLELFGLSLQHQLGVGSIGVEDANSFMFYLPGPSVGFLQGLVGGLFGVSGGRGADLSSAGRSLNPDEQRRLLTQSMPYGVQVNRVLQALRLIQTDGTYRRALDVSQFLGMEPSSGDLIAEKAASFSQILGQVFGVPSSDKEYERQRLNKQLDIEREHDVIVGRAGSYVLGGRPDLARAELGKFLAKYEGDEFVGTRDPMSLLKPPTLRAAQKRHDLPPGKRRLAPDWARNWSTFGPPPGSIFEESP